MGYNSKFAKIKSRLERSDYHTERITINKLTGTIIKERLSRYYLDSFSFTDGWIPAKIIYNQSKGILIEEYYSGHKLFSNNGLPARIIKDKSTIIKEWYYDDKLERRFSDLPARITITKTNIINEWYYGGKLHKTETIPIVEYQI